MLEMKVPPLGESISEATVASWKKKVGDAVLQDEAIAELDTDKVSVEVLAPKAGILTEIRAPQGSTVGLDAVLGIIEEGAVSSAVGAGAGAPTVANPPAHSSKAEEKQSSAQPALSPSVRKAVQETGADVSQISGTGPKGRITREDVASAATTPAGASKGSSSASNMGLPEGGANAKQDAKQEERIPMTRLRKTIAQRLKQAQDTAAILTTFNEVDMSRVMQLRAAYKDIFEKKHGIKLGFMGFFVKACIQALQEIPAVQAQIEGDDLVFRNYYHIGVAVGTERGLVVPVVKHAEMLGIAGIEKAIAAFGKKAKEGTLTMEDMQGGTFTISNGGIYGSLMSTPILNQPQSGILGMHKIQKRPIVVDEKTDRVEVRPMMYLALSYDHRVVDGKEAVTFLVRVKESLEDPSRLLLDM